MKSPQIVKQLYIIVHTLLFLNFVFYYLHKLKDMHPTVLVLNFSNCFKKSKEATVEA